ncbi:hypothetical protein [Kiloniella majae]|uniref:hypothetical protein n=1 Tax=Kiloniella majae TaxID=1938558 RepID=UPI000A277848|nr:hypothetical protein [Kiloniella majae]
MATNLKGSRALLQALDAVTAMEQAGQQAKRVSLKNSDNFTSCHNSKDQRSSDVFDFLLSDLKKLN